VSSERPSASGNEESPVDLMKRCTGSVLRAVAGRGDLDVAFAAAGSSVRGTEVRLPAPPRTLGPADLIRLRGTADAVALRFRYHTEALHGRYMPPGPEARKVYEAVEQARIEALGPGAWPASPPISPASWNSGAGPKDWTASPAGKRCRWPRPCA